jgi:hypothetical protein
MLVLGLANLYRQTNRFQAGADRDVRYALR